MISSKTHETYHKTFLMLAFEVVIISLISFAFIFKLPSPLYIESSESNSKVIVDLHSLLDNLDQSALLQSLKNLIKQSFSIYSNNCFESDYIQPLTKKCINQSGISLTAIDSLDTLILINDTENVNKINNFLNSPQFVCKSLPNQFISTQYITTHIIGGLISAYSLTSNQLYLKKAKDCAEMAMISFKNDIPKPFFNPNRKTHKTFSWIPGTTLSESSSFSIEFRTLALLTNTQKYQDLVDRYYTCVSKQILSNDKLYLFWSTNSCSNLTSKEGFSILSSRFLANTLRYYILSPSNETEMILDYFIKKLESNSLRDISRTSDSLDPRFDSSFCELLPLLRVYKRNALELIKKLNGKCRNLMDLGLLATSAKMEKRFLNIDQKGFDYQSSLIEDVIINHQNEDMRFTFLNATERLNCSNAFCELFSQKPDIIHDFMPPESISKWAKYLLFLPGELAYDTFVFNEAGHIIPKI